MRLYIIRHADPDYGNDSITKKGHLEAKALAGYLAEEGIDKIYCSPLGRALATAKYTSELLNINYEIEDWTQELSHSVELETWGKMHICDVPGEVVRCLNNDESHETWYKRKPYNDSELLSKIEKIHIESDDFLKRHGYERHGERFKCVDPNRKKIAVFCHAALGMTWLAYLLGIPSTIMWTGFWPAPSSITTVLFEEHSQKWAVPRCIKFGDTSHLFASKLPISTMGIKANFY